MEEKLSKEELEKFDALLKEIASIFHKTQYPLWSFSVKENGVAAVYFYGDAELCKKIKRYINKIPRL